MKKDTWKTVIQIAISILTAIATSCIGSRTREICVICEICVTKKIKKMIV